MMPLRPANPSENRQRRLQERYGSSTLIYIRDEVFTIPVRLHESDHVLLCKHVFENHYRGRLYSHPGGKFNREDGSTEAAKVTLFCPACLKIPRTEIDCHEWVWRDGKFWLADRLPNSANEEPSAEPNPAGGKEA